MNKRSSAGIFFRRNRSLFVCVVSMVFTIIIVTGVIVFAVMHIFGLFGYFPGKLAPFMLVMLFILVSTALGALICSAINRTVIRHLENIRKAMKAVEQGDFSVRVPPDGSYGEMSALIGSFNRMVEELGGIEMFRSDFINSFSHEFRTPIVSIQGFASQLKKDSLPPEKRTEYIDIIISESRRLTKLSSNILMLNKLENQQYITDSSDFYLDEQLRSCILLLEKQWTAKNIDFDLDLPSIPYHGNQEMLSQAWVNIIGNAIKYSFDNSTISVCASLRADRVRVDVTDNGEGMDENTIHHIFERFYQGDSAHASEGNGLGLPLVKRIIELCSGTIRVDSQKGKGTIFTVFLPIKD